MSATQRIELKGNNIMFNYLSFKGQIEKEIDLGNKFKKIISQIEECEGEEKVEKLEQSIRTIDSIIKEKKIRLEAAENYLNYIIECVNDRRKEKDDRLNELREEVSILKGEGGIKRKEEEFETPKKKAKKSISIRELKEVEKKEEKVDKRKSVKKDTKEVKEAKVIKETKEKADNNESVEDSDTDFKLNKRLAKKYQKLFEEKELGTLSDNAEILMQWCEMNKMRILYDSISDGRSTEIILEKIHRKANLYFVIVDGQDNVFGGFISHPIKTLCEKEDENIEIIEDENHFVFELSPNGDKTNSKKWEQKNGEEISVDDGIKKEMDESPNESSCYGDIKLWKGNEFIISIGNFYSGWLDVASIGNNCSYNHSLYKVYSDMDKSCLNGNGKNFTVERIIVIQMGN